MEDEFVILANNTLDKLYKEHGLSAIERPGATDILAAAFRQVDTDAYVAGALDTDTDAYFDTE